MAKVVIASLQPTGRSGGAVTVKRVRTDTGELKTIRTVDAGRETFGEDLQRVFAKNVAKARRENRELFGVSDLASAKR